MSLSVIAACDICEHAGLGEKAARFEVPFSDTTGEGYAPDGWARVEITLSTRVVPPEQDGMAAAIANLPAFMSEYGSAFVAQQARPFSTTLHVCPACRETLGVAYTIVAARLREREYTDAESVPPPHEEPPSLHHLRPVE